MKILLVGNYLNDRQVSINRFVGLMEKGLIKMGHQVQRIQPQPIIGQLSPSFTGIGKWLGYIDKLLLFPIQLRQFLDAADIVCICDQGFAYYTRYIQQKPHVVICHDMFAIRSAIGEIPENPTSWTGKQYQKIILRGLKQSQYIACSSEATRADVVRIAQVKPEQTIVIEDCLDETYEIMPPEEAAQRVKKLNVSLEGILLLHVGGNQWYKNRLGLLHIFNALRKCLEGKKIRLAMVGKPLTEKMRQYIHDQGLEQQVIELVALADDDLRAMYSLATALIFPSLAEGFGVPVIEAQTCGTPVFTSNRLPMTHICADGAVYFDPTKPESAAQITAQILLNPEKMNQMREKGLKNAQRFTFKRMLQSYSDLFAKILAGQETLDSSPK
jgi:glycosyltransferase involved in cell wall biosynthesis